MLLFRWSIYTYEASVVSSRPMSSAVSETVLLQNTTTKTIITYFESPWLIVLCCVGSVIQYRSTRTASLITCTGYCTLTATMSSSPPPRMYTQTQTDRHTDSVAPDSLCVAWLNDGLARCECRSGVKLQWMTYPVCSHSSSSSSLCVVPLPAALASTATRRPNGLLMVHAALTLAANVWLCGMTRVQADPQRFVLKIQPKIVGLYTSIYGR